MSQIDEAFIQAYSTPQQPPSVPGAGEVPIAPVQPPLAGLHSGPNIQLHAASAPAQEIRENNAPRDSWAPEPMPSPHFRFPNESQPAASAPPTPPAQTQAPTTERRPLSAFATPEPAPTTAFNPVFEVDAFRWPKITDQLLAEHHELLIPVAEQLLDVSEQGRSLIGLAGTRPDVGCSTLLLSLARLMGSVDKSIAIIDANFAKASLAQDLGLEFEVGWEQVLTGELPLAECVVKSIDDRMALLPLTRPHTHAHELLASIHTSITAGVLRYHYDVVLFNLGAAVHAPQDAAAYNIMEHCRLDANVIVADTERTGLEPMDTLLSLFGSTCLGVIGNSAV